jgi:hypothetical protein
MNDAVADGNKDNVLILAEPPPRLGDCSSDVGYLISSVFFADQDGVIICMGAQPRFGTNALHLASNQPYQACGATNPEYLKFQAGRSTIYDKYCFHDTTLCGW